MRKKSPASGDDASVAGEPGVGAREKKIEEGYVLQQALGVMESGRQPVAKPKGRAHPCRRSVRPLRTQRFAAGTAGVSRRIPAP